MLKQTIIPCLRYADAPAAIKFIREAYGFSEHVVYADENDSALIHHAQLRLGDCMVMVSSARPGETTDLYRWKTPVEAGGVTTSIYCVVDDADAHYARAKEAGSGIITEVRDSEGHPGRGYTARDPEGNVWSFGTYDPWA